MNIRQSWCLSALCLLLSANVFSQTKSVVSNAEHLVTQWIALEKQKHSIKKRVARYTATTQAAYCTA